MPMVINNPGTDFTVRRIVAHSFKPLLAYRELGLRIPASTLTLRNYVCAFLATKTCLAVKESIDTG